MAVQPPLASPAFNRTQEFRSIVAERQAWEQSVTKPPDSRPPVSRSEFSAAASRIGSDIYSCAEKLGKLTQLAQSRSLFEESGQANEINELTLVIKADITDLNAKIAQLQAHQAQLRSQQRRPDQQINHSSKVVDSLKAALADTTIGFKDVLQTRSQNMKLLHDRRQHFKPESIAEGGGAGSGLSTNGFSSFSDVGPPASIFECVASESTGSDASAGPSWASPGAKPLKSAVDHSRHGGEAVVIDMGFSQQQLQTQQLVPSEYLEQRAQAVDSVTRTIAELGTIYQQLATMVAEQGTMLQRIDDNVEESLISVEAGHEQLQKYWSNLSSNRGLIMRVFAIMMFFIVLWGAFFA